MCEIESDFTPLRWRVARVLHRALGLAPSQLNLETRFMVREREPEGSQAQRRSASAPSRRTEGCCVVPSTGGVAG
jgi:hypothetical protein